MPAPLHPLLARQLKRLGLETDEAPSPAWRELLERVSLAYADTERERYLLERSQALASQEMAEIHEALRLSESRFANLIALSSDWIWEQDADLLWAPA